MAKLPPIDKISAFTQRNPVSLARNIGHRLRTLRLGNEHDVNRPADIVQQVVNAVGNWETHAMKNGINPANIAMVVAQHRLSL